VVASFRVTLSPVTPIHVWNGSELIVGLDAVVDMKEKTLAVIDISKSMESLNQKDLDSIVNLAVRGRIEDAFKEIARRAVYSTTIPLKVVRLPASEQRVRALHSFIVPGSTLKGYLRTSLIHAMLSENIEKAKMILDKVKLEGKPTTIAEALERALLETERLRLQGGFFDALMTLSISDPMVKSSSLAVREIRFIDILSFSEIASIYAVTFESGELTYDVKVQVPPSPELVVASEEARRELERIWSLVDRTSRRLGSIESIRELLKGYGCELIREEFEKIGRVSSLHAKSLDRYVETLKKLEELCRETSECIPARIGFATGHEAKTIAVFLKRNYPELYGKVKEFMSKVLGRSWDSLTLKVTPDGDSLLGLGWCKLCLHKT